MPEALHPAEQKHLRDVLERGLAALKDHQHEDGHFCGELEGDSILESEYILMKFILGQEHAPMEDGASGPQTLRKIARALRRRQRTDGGWGQFPGSDVDLSATVKAYFALKLVGDDPAAPHMVSARQRVREAGGAERCNSFSSFYLACLGQIPWRAVPAIPPEIVLLPRWFYFNLANVSAWTRTMILPLSLVVTLRPTRRLPPRLGIDELFCDPAERGRLTLVNEPPRRWGLFFRIVDRVLKIAHGAGAMPLRRIALHRAEQWIRQRAGQDGVTATDGLGAIFPPMVYIQIALHARGRPRSHPVRRRAERELDALFIEEDDAIRIQPCFSPVWDTGIALYALNDCGLRARDAAAGRAAAWLRSKECRHIGDWATRMTRPPTPGAWFFEYNNAWYPDVDDTAMVAMALRRTGGAENASASERGVRWLLAMQNDDGGWAAFDRTRHRRLLEYVPFADHNAMQDPSCPDITGRVLECLASHGRTVHDPPVQRALAFIRSRQEREGCFFGRWGVNYVYGTWQAVVGPLRCGVDPDEPWVQRAGRWLKSIQHRDGGFGESALSYEDPAGKGRGPATASQTAWAAMTLLEVYGPGDPDLRRAIRWLAETQLTDDDARDPARNPDGDGPGSWVEREFTGTGFPRVFYLRYHLYRVYFPVMALGRFLAAHRPPEQCLPTVKVQPKLEVAGT